MKPSYTFTETDHRRAPVNTASSFTFNTSKFAGKHSPAVAKKIAAAKKSLRESTRLYHAAVAAIEGKPSQSAKSGVLVVCSRKVRFLRTEEETITQRLRCLSPTENENLTDVASVVKEVFELAPGQPTIVPAWVVADKFFASLQKDGALSAL